VHLLDKNVSPTEEEVKECISATVCRCTGYNSIERAVHRAAREMKQRRKEARHG